MHRDREKSLPSLERELDFIYFFPIIFSFYFVCLLFPFVGPAHIAWADR